MKSINTKSFNAQLTAVDGQLSLGLPGKPLLTGLQIPLSEIVGLSSKKRALFRCVELSGKDDQTIAEALDIDKAQWSRIKNGGAHFPEDKEIELMQICGNYVPLIWELYACGFDPDSIRPLQSEMERAMAAKDAELAELRNEREVMMKLLRDMKGAI